MGYLGKQGVSHWGYSGKRDQDAILGQNERGSAHSVWDREGAGFALFGVFLLFKRLNFASEGWPRCSSGSKFFYKSQLIKAVVLNILHLTSQSKSVVGGGGGCS